MKKGEEREGRRGRGERRGKDGERGWGEKRERGMREEGEEKKMLKVKGYHDLV